MPRRGLSARIGKIQKATGGIIERLEERRLLTTWTGGGFAANGDPIVNTFFYKDFAGSTVRVSVGGNVTAEAIFFDGAGPADAIPPNPSLTGRDLFQVYVAQSDINSYISITAVDPTTGRLTPFSSGTTTYTIRPNAAKGTTITASSQANSGNLTLGGQTVASSGRPIIKLNTGGAGFGVRPAGLDDLPNDPANISAGLIVAPGLSLGKFLFAGTVMGKVEVPGNMNTFYAGWLLTGDARGVGEGSFGVQNGQVIGDGLPHENESGFPVVPRGNFHVGGSLQNLATVSPIGWDGTFGDIGDAGPFFLTGTDIKVDGKLGQVVALGGVASPVTVVNSTTVIDAGIIQEELEASGSLYFTPRGTTIFGADFSDGVLHEDTVGGGEITPFDNDESAQAQFLGAFNTSLLGSNSIVVRGVIDALRVPTTRRDRVDWYGVALMAGQTITVQLVGQGTAHVGVYDPDGRQVASDYDNALALPNVNGNGSTGVVSPGDIGPQLVVNRPFQFTADRPGVYRFAIAQQGNTDFLNTDVTPLRSIGNETYELRIANVGNLAYGGQRADGEMLDTVPAEPLVRVENGDAGGIEAGGTGLWVTAAKGNVAKPVDPRVPQVNFPVLPSFLVFSGNLRSVQGTRIGSGTSAPGGDTILGGSGPDFALLGGSVGLVRSTTGIVYINPSAQGVGGAYPVAGNYQVIDASTSFWGAVNANGSIGIIRTGLNIGSTVAGQTFITADADNTGNDGFIDLIDVTGALNAPAISHGPGGNVRYIRVRGDMTIDPLFSGGFPSRIWHGFNNSVQLTDDSGSVITLTPLGQSQANPTFNPTAAPGDINSYQFFGPSLTTLVYPIRSGGVVIIDAHSTGGMAVTATGGTTAEISRLEVHGSGIAPERFTDARSRELDVRLPRTLNPITDTLEVRIGGSAIVDVGYIGVLQAESQTSLITGPTVDAFGGATSISNTTGGEIVSVNATSIGNLYSRGTLGLTKSSIPGNTVNFLEDIRSGNAFAGRTIDTGPTNPATGTLPRAASRSGDAGSVFPFNRQTFGIVVDGDIVSARADMGLGNFLVNGIIGTLTANGDGVDVPGVFEGINAPVWAWSPSANPGTADGGSIIRIQIGEGLPWSGSGDFARSGIFADNYIGSITNQGAGSDIRGDIVFHRRLGNITLRDGAIIDSDIVQQTNDTQTTNGRAASSFEVTREGQGGIGYLFQTVATPGNRPINSIDSINLTGGGLMIGTNIIVNALGTLTSSAGIFTSGFLSTPEGRITKMTAGGWGIRAGVFRVGGSVGSISAPGNGSLLPTSAATGSVRFSEQVQPDAAFQTAFDPGSGLEFNIHNDLHRYFGTSAATPSIPGVTDTGVIEDLYASGQRDLGSIQAQIIRSREIAPFNDPNDPTSPASTLFPSQLNFGTAIGLLQTRGLIDGLRVVTGRLNKFQPGSDVLALNMTVAGPLNNVRINGSLGGNSIIFATGPFGTINNLSIAGDLFGTLRSSGRMGNITVGRNVIGTIQVDGGARGVALNKLTVGGGIQSGSVIVNGSIGTVQTAGGLGSAGDTFRVTGNLNRLRVGVATPGTLAADVTVLGNVGSIEVHGRIDGKLTLGTLNNRVSNILVNGLDPNLGAVNGDWTINGTLTRATINGGNVNANVTVSEDINSFSINGGSLAATKTITSTTGSIKSVTIRGGNLFGSVTAPNGTIGSIIVDGNLGNGVDPLTIASNALNLLSVGASILKLATVRINGPIGTLQVGGNIEAGAAVVATQISRQQVGSAAPGTIVVTG